MTLSPQCSPLPWGQSDHINGMMEPAPFVLLMASVSRPVTQGPHKELQSAWDSIHSTKRGNADKHSFLFGGRGGICS